MENPFKQLMLYACDKATAEYLAGNMSLDEATDYADKLCNELVDTDECQQMLEDYFNNFIDVKNIGDINDESN